MVGETLMLLDLCRIRGEKDELFTPACIVWRLFICDQTNCDMLLYSASMRGGFKYMLHERMQACMC